MDCSRGLNKQGKKFLELGKKSGKILFKSELFKVENSELGGFSENYMWTVLLMVCSKFYDCKGADNDDSVVKVL